MTQRRVDERYTELTLPDAPPADGDVSPSSEERLQGASWDDVSLADRILRLRTLLSFAVAAVVIAVALSQFDLDVRAIVSQISRANPAFFGLAMLTYYGSFAVRAARWRSLLQSADVQPGIGHAIPPLPGLVIIFVLSWFANCLVPAKLGDAYRGYLLKRRARVSFSGTLGTIFAERLTDLITLAIVLVSTGLLIFGRQVPAAIRSWLWVAAILSVTLVLGIFAMHRFRTLLRSVVPHRLRDHYVGLEQGTLKSFNRLPALLGFTLAIWLLEGVRVYFVGLSLDSGLTMTTALFVALLISLLTAVPVTPAGLAFVEVGVVGILTFLGTSQQLAASVAVLDRVVAYWSVILIGGVLHLIVHWRWR